jgi:hypothetical protein
MRRREGPVRTDLPEEEVSFHLQGSLKVHKCLFIKSVICINGLKRSPVSPPGSVDQLLVTANIVPSSLILSTLMIEETFPSETSILTTPTRSHVPGYGMPRGFSSLERNATGPLIVHCNQFSVTSYGTGTYIIIFIII